jgi:cobalt-zinc-cadmium efflux system membrane fusion protein
VQADVYEKDIAAIRQGQSVMMSIDAYPGETFTGRLTYVSDVLDPTTRAAKVRCEAPNADGRLKLEMFATIHIPTLMGRDAVMIPRAAVQQMDGQSVVFVRTGDGQFQKRGVRLGSSSDGWVEIVDGVKTGEPVVTDGVFILKSELEKQQFGEHEH